MKKFSIIILVFALFLCGCGRDAADFLGYQERDFAAEIRVSGERNFGGVFEKRGDDARFTFSSPENMSGIEARRQGDKTTVTLDGVTVENRRICDAFLSIEKVFSLDGDVLSVERTTDAARGRVTVVRLLSGGKNHTICIADGRPFRVTFDGTTVDIVWMEFLQ